MSNNADQVPTEAPEVEDLEPVEETDTEAMTTGTEIPRGDQTDAEQDHVQGEDSNDLLVEEGEIAADYLEELLDLADLDGDIDIEVRNGRIYLSVLNEEGTPEDLLTLVGDDGEVLDSLQELVRLAVLASTDRRSRLVLDIAGHREQRADQLRDMAMEAVERARSTGQGIHLDPLSPYERKIVHDVVAEAGLHSESEGEGASRHIVVSLKD